MNDIVTRLRTWVHAVEAVPASDLMDQAASHIELLESANAHSHSGFMVLASAVDGMTAEIELLRGYRDAAESDLAVAMTAAERLRLTDVERAAVQRAVEDENDRGMGYTADVLQSMLGRLSANGDCPAPDNVANEDTVGRILARRITGLQSTLEHREDVRRLEAAIAAGQPTLTDAERDSLKFAIKQLKYIRADKAAAPLVALLERRQDTPAAYATPPEGSEQDVCTLTDEERKAVTTAMHAYGEDNADEECCAIEATLWGLLERL